MKFYVGSDHAGFAVKGQVIEMLKTKGHDVVDLGPENGNRVDYPDYAEKVSHAVISDEGSYGILICGTGIGMSIAANKIDGIRAAHCNDYYTAQMARAHNDANILCFGERVSGPGVIESMIEAFTTTEFEGGRHVGRVEKIMALQKSH